MTNGPNGFERKRSNNPLVIKLSFKMNTTCKHKVITRCWIPNHIGVEGNNKSSLAVKSDFDIDVDRTTKISDYKEVINKYIQME